LCCNEPHEEVQKEKGTSPIWIAKKLHMNYSSINADARKASQPRIED
jgi:hypothetical protein